MRTKRFAGCAAVALAWACASTPPRYQPEFAEDVTIGPRDVVTRPEIIDRVAPRYDQALRDERIQGLVIAKVIITRTGAVIDIRIERADHPLLEQAVRQALPRWRFKPATVNGAPVAAYYQLTQAFKLQ